MTFFLFLLVLTDVLDQKKMHVSTRLSLDVVKKLNAIILDTLITIFIGKFSYASEKVNFYSSPEKNLQRSLGSLLLIFRMKTSGQKCTETCESTMSSQYQRECF